METSIEVEHFDRITGDWFVVKPHFDSIDDARDWIGNYGEAGERYRIVSTSIEEFGK